MASPSQPSKNAREGQRQHVGSFGSPALLPVARTNTPHRASEAGPSDEQVRVALDQLLSRPLFAAAKRSSQLLRYLVEEVLAGRGKGVSEYAIALDVFGRSEDFDHRIDTCVRTEAWRLRGRLQRHYENEGRDDTVRFTFAPRSFVPTFQQKLAPIVVAAQADLQRMSVFVDCEATARDHEKHFARRLVEELGSGLLALPSVSPVLTDATDGADLRLRCAVRTESDWTRIVATLVDQGQQVMGAKTFSFPRESTLISPLVVADGVRGMVQRSLSNEARSASVDLFEQTDDTPFLDRLLRGEHANRAQQLVRLRKEVSRHEKVIADDPLDRLAHRRLIGTLGQFLSLVPSATHSVMPKLGACAHAALSLDEGLGDVWLTLGWASSYAHDWSETERACRRAISIAPLDPSGYILLTLTFLQKGELSSAVELAETAMALDPFSPMVANAYALTLNCARRFREAADVASYALEAEPGFVKLRLTLGEAMLNMGQLDRAIEEFAIAYEMMPQDAAACGLLGFAYGLSGDVGSATQMLAKLRNSPELRGQTTYAEAIVNIGLGERDEAIEALGQAVQRRGTPGLLLANPTFDTLRADRRFLKIQRQMEMGSQPAKAA